MPHKLNAAHRHKFREETISGVKLGQSTEILRRRGDLRAIWVTDDTQMISPVGERRAGRLRDLRQPLYSNIAIETCLTLRTIYKLPLSPTQGLMRNGISASPRRDTIPVPDFSTVAPGLGLSDCLQPRVDASRSICWTVRIVSIARAKWLRVKHETAQTQIVGESASAWTSQPARSATDLTLDHVGDSLSGLARGSSDQFDGPVSAFNFWRIGAYDGTPTRNLLTARFVRCSRGHHSTARSP